MLTRDVKAISIAPRRANHRIALARPQELQPRVGTTDPYQPRATSPNRFSLPDTRSRVASNAKQAVAGEAADVHTRTEDDSWEPRETILATKESRAEASMDDSSASRVGISAARSTGPYAHHHHVRARREGSTRAGTAKTSARRAL
jgi:hypothetical protein